MGCMNKVRALNSMTEHRQDRTDDIIINGLPSLYLIHDPHCCCCCCSPRDRIVEMPIPKNVPQVRHWKEEQEAHKVK